jgi:subtilisin family serine protease
VDCAAIFDGRKVGAWAATLDELARELNVLIIGTTGNRMPRAGEALEEGITAYPLYLTEDQNRFQEPAGAMNILTVGALAHGEGIDATHADAVTVQPITRAGEPSPFSRRGPGIGGATKPDLIDIGGTFVFDAVVRRLLSGRELPSAGVLTLYNRPIDRLFTAGSGTSFAAPNLAFKASQLLARFPAASTNLLRALLVGSASRCQTLHPNACEILASKQSQIYVGTVSSIWRKRRFRMMPVSCSMQRTTSRSIILLSIPCPCQTFFDQSGASAQFE